MAVLKSTALELRVVTLFDQGMSKRAIARSLGLGRNRVKRILRKHAARRNSGHSALPSGRARAPRPSKLDPYRDATDELLEKYPDITAQRVFEELKATGYKGGYSIVKTLVRKLRPKPAVKISLPTPSYGPGEMAECDWADYVISFTDEPRRKIQVFGYTLTFSRRKCFSLHERNDLHALMDGHVAAFSRLGGAAHNCKYDNQKPVVLRWEAKQPIYNPRFIDFATYYQFGLHACRPRRPNDKPRVERSFWEFEQSFLNGRTFRDLDDMAQQLAVWMDTICDLRPHKQLRTTAIERFPEEQPHLLPLPAHPYDTARVVYRVCDAEGCIPWEGNHYEIPYDYVTELLPVRITATKVLIYASDLSCIAIHPRLARGAHQRAELAGRRPPGREPRGPTLDQLRVVYRDMGPQADDFLAGLIDAQRAAAHHARVILTLRERYSTEALVSALAHARTYHAFDHRSVERILQARAKPRRLDEYVAEATARRLDEVLDQSRTEPRSLEGYDALPCFSPNQGELCQGSDNPSQLDDQPRASATPSETPSEC